MDKQTNLQLPIKKGGGILTILSGIFFFSW